MCSATSVCLCVFWMNRISINSAVFTQRSRVTDTRTDWLTHHATGSSVAIGWIVGNLSCQLEVKNKRRVHLYWAAVSHAVIYLVSLYYKPAWLRLCGQRSGLRLYNTHINVPYSVSWVTLSLRFGADFDYRYLVLLSTARVQQRGVAFSSICLCVCLYVCVY